MKFSMVHVKLNKSKQQVSYFTKNIVLLNVKLMLRGTKVKYDPKILNEVREYGPSDKSTMDSPQNVGAV